MNCPKCGSQVARVLWLRNEVGSYRGVVSCPLCGHDHYFDVTSEQPRVGRGKVVKLPGARKKRGVPGYHPHDREISGIDGRGTR